MLTSTLQQHTQPVLIMHITPLCSFSTLWQIHSIIFFALVICFPLCILLTLSLLISPNQKLTEVANTGRSESRRKGRRKNRRKGRSERKVTKKHYSDSLDSSYSLDSSDSSDSHMGRSRSRMGCSESRRKGRSERKVTKKYYSDSRKGRSERKVTKKHSSDSSIRSLSLVSSDCSLSSVDKKLESSASKYFLKLLKLADILGYPYEEYRPAMNGITDQASIS